MTGGTRDGSYPSQSFNGKPERCIDASTTLAAFMTRNYEPCPNRRLHGEGRDATWSQADDQVHRGSSGLRVSGSLNHGGCSKLPVPREHHLVI